MIAVLISIYTATHTSSLPLLKLQSACLWHLLCLITSLHNESDSLCSSFAFTFYDGLNTCLRALRRSFPPHCHTVGLALVTISIVGVVTITLTELAYPYLLLAAIITPTDAVAVSSVTANIEMPEEAMQTLKIVTFQ